MPATKITLPSETAGTVAAPGGASAPVPLKKRASTFFNGVFKDTDQEEVPTPKAMLGLTFGNKNHYEELMLEEIDTNTLLTSNHAGSNQALLERRAFDIEVIMNGVWAEFFGLARLVTVIAFTLLFQAVRTTTWGIKRFVLLPSLIFGTESFGPSLWVLYEGYCHPALVVALSLVKAGCLFLRVTGDSLLAFVAPVIGIVQAFRLVEVVQNYHTARPEEAAV